MFRCKGKRVRSINCPQTSVCQDRLRTNNDLKAENCWRDSSAPIALLASVLILRTLLTRDMTANMAASAITVVSMPDLERLVAILCPCKKSKSLVIFQQERAILNMPAYLAEGSTFCHDDMKLAFASSVFEECLNGTRTSDSHDDFIGVNVLQGLHGNVVSSPLCSRTQQGQIFMCNQPLQMSGIV